MSLTEKLISVPQREQAGSKTTARYEYQALWGLALIFKNHGSLPDYAVCFEFHDDVVFLDSAQNPTSVRFYQVKTKEQGHWTITDLLRRKKTSDEKGFLPSFIGKLQGNYENFPDETQALVFVSNAECTAFKDATGTAFSEIGKDEFKKFLEKLQKECSKADEHSAKLMHFEVADLSLADAAAHLKGKLHELVISELGDVTFSLDALYKTAVEECRLRSKYSGPIKSLSDLMKVKAIKKSQVTEWLQAVKAAHTLPTWESIAPDLQLPAIPKAALHREWISCRAEALDQGNEAANKLRDAIRTSLKKSPQSLGLLPLIEFIESSVANDAAKLLPILKNERLRVMILYEVYSHDATGNIQAVDPQPSGKAK